MKKVLIWVGGIIVALLLIAALSSWILASSFNKKFDKVYDLQPEPIAIPTDSASIERGRALSVDCRVCHGADLGGEVFFDDPTIGVLPSSNLTRAKGSQTEHYVDIDFVRALRHGLNKAGHPLMIMPSESITHMSDEDLGCLIAFLKTLKPVERNFAMRKFTYLSQAMAGAGMFGNLFSYDVIDHEKAMHVTAPPMSTDPEYGKYVVAFNGCTSCHGKDFGGGKSPDPVSPPVPDISKSGVPGNWTLAQFIETFRSGRTPEGKTLDVKFMPFVGLGALSDMEIESVYNYIHSLPPAKTME